MTPPVPRIPCRSGRGAVLIAVLVVVALAALAAMTILLTADARVASASATLKRSQSRATAWSAVQACVSQLAAQRETLLMGGAPTLDAEIVVAAPPGSPASVAVLEPLTPEGALAVSEGAKINLNTATPEMLTAAGLEKEVADAIVSARAAGPFASIEDLPVGIDLAGSMDRRRSKGDQPGPAPAATDLLTTLSADANVQLAILGESTEWRGLRRINVNTPWSDGLGDAITKRFGKNASDLLKDILSREQPFTSRSALLGFLEGVQMPAQEWGRILDIVTTSPDEYLVGPIDLNTASADVLGCLPGLTREDAARLITARGSLSPEQRCDLAWPVRAGVLTGAQLKGIADAVTTRSLQWRVRVTAGWRSAGDRDADRNADEPALRYTVTWDVVIDVSSERPRVAYLRDRTMDESVRAYHAVRASFMPNSDRDSAPELPENPAENDDTVTGVESPPADPIAGEQPESNTPPPGETPAGADPQQPQDRRVGRWKVPASGRAPDRP